jgi:mRNA interferase RelE/StbE
VAYSIQFKPAAFRSLARLEKDTQTRLARKIDALSRNPRPLGAEKLKGIADLYRVRVGDYRILYQIQDAVLLILIIQIGHRREIYR